MRKLLILLGFALICLSGMAAPFQDGSSESVTVKPEWREANQRYFITHDQDSKGIIFNMNFTYLTWSKDDYGVMTLNGDKLSQKTYDGKTYGSLWSCIVKVNPGNIISMLGDLNSGTLSLYYDQATATFTLPEGYAVALGAFSGNYPDKKDLSSWLYVCDFKLTYMGGTNIPIRDYTREMWESDWKVTLTDALSGSDANAITGDATMTASLNSAAGTQQTYTIPSSYLNEKLTLSCLGEFQKPIVFSLDVKTGAVTAEASQVAANVSGTDYFYRSLSNTAQGITGKLTDNRDGKTCLLTLDNWEAVSASNQKTGSVYYNTKIEIPYYIPDLPKTPDVRSGTCTIRAIKDSKLEQWNAEAIYDVDNRILTIYKFGGPDMEYIYFKFKGDSAFGEAPANQEAYTDEPRHYYYSYNKSVQAVIYPGYLRNVSTTQSSLEVQPTWYTMSSQFGVSHTYQQAVVTMDFTIPDLPAYDPGTKPKPDDPGDGKEYNGSMTYNADSEKGDYRSSKVNGKYDASNKTLTVTDFAGNENPLVFDITLATGAAVAKAGQSAGDFDYGKGYYSGSASDAQVPIEAVYTNDGGKSRLEIAPVFYKGSMPGTYAAFYNAVIIFDFTVEGLAEYEEPEVREPLPVEGEWYFTVVVDDYNGNLQSGRRDEKYIATLNPDDNSLYFEWESYGSHLERYPDFKGFYNAETGVISFPNQDLEVKWSSRTMYQRPMFYNQGAGYWEIRPIAAQFSDAAEKKAEKIRFSSNEGFVWYDTPGSFDLENVIAGPIIFAEGFREGGNVPEPPKVKYLGLDNVECEVIDCSTAQYEFDVVAQYLAEDAPITAYYTFFQGTVMPSEVQYTVVPESADGRYYFTLEDLKPLTTYGVRIYAEGDGLTTAVWKGEFKTPAVPDSGVDAIGAEESETRYFTPQGIEVRNPATGDIYIRVS